MEAGTPKCWATMLGVVTKRLTGFKLPTATTCNRVWRVAWEKVSSRDCLLLRLKNSPSICKSEPVCGLCFVKSILDTTKSKFDKKGGF